jgi:hypothetical protein
MRGRARVRSRVAARASRGARVSGCRRAARSLGAALSVRSRKGRRAGENDERGDGDDCKLFHGETPVRSGATHESSWKRLARRECSARAMRIERSVIALGVR